MADRFVPEGAQITTLVEQYALARIMENASVPTRSQRSNAICVASHERARRESERLAAEIARSVGALGEAMGLVTSLVGCAGRLDATERHMVARVEGCGWCGGDHLAELSALITGSQPSGVDR